jgi:hypothetical protein
MSYPRYSSSQEIMTDMEAKYQNQVPTMAVYNVQADCYEEIDKSRLATPATHSYNWDSYYASTTSPNLSDGVSLVYSSPKSTASDAPAPTSQEQETPEKNTDRASSAPPKRKRENRYKDAPPSVLSVRSLFKPIPSQRLHLHHHHRYSSYLIHKQQ